MKLYATIKNERGGKKSTGDDTRIMIDLSYKNRQLGTIALYRIFELNQDLGYSIIWNPTNKQSVIIATEESEPTGHRCYEQHARGQYSGCSIPHWHDTKGKQQTGNRDNIGDCGYKNCSEPLIYGTDHCTYHQTP